MMCKKKTYIITNAVDYNYKLGSVGLHSACTHTYTFKYTIIYYLK